MPKTNISFVCRRCYRFVRVWKWGYKKMRKFNKISLSTMITLSCDEAEKEKKIFRISFTFFHASLYPNTFRQKERKISFWKRSINKNNSSKAMDGMMNRNICIWRFSTIYILIFWQTNCYVKKDEGVGERRRIVDEEKRTLAL